MTTIAMVAVGLAAGALAGLAFFGGLAATVARLPTSARPAGLLVVSVLVRFAALAAVLVGVALLGPTPLLAAVAGLLATRAVLIRRSAVPEPTATE